MRSLKRVCLVMSSLLISQPLSLIKSSCAEVSNSGVKLGAAFVGELGARLDTPARGREHTEGRWMLTTPLSVNMKEALGVNLGELSLLGMVIKEDLDLMDGRVMVDDAHAYSNLRAEDRIQLFQLSWERRWGEPHEGAWLARLGKLDANDHFAVSESASYLINGAAGFSPSILGLTSYPDSAWSAQLGYARSRYELLLGVFDGGSVTLEPTPTGARFGLSDAALSGALFWVAQATFHLGNADRSAGDTTADAPLHVTFGAWTHRGELIAYPAARPTAHTAHPISVRGHPGSGLYLTGDLKLAQLSGGRALHAGWQAAVSPSVWPLHLSATLTLSEVWGPLWGAEEGGRLTFGASHLATQSGEPTYGFGDDAEQLVELTLATALGPYAGLSLSGVHLFGAAGERDVHIIVSRVTLTTR